MMSSVDRPSCHYPMTVHSSSKAGSPAAASRSCHMPSLVRSVPQLSLIRVARPELELVDRRAGHTHRVPAVSSTAVSASPPPALSALAGHNLFAGAEFIAARAASASTRRQYRAIFHAFGDWPAGELGPPPRRRSGHRCHCRLWPILRSGRCTRRAAGGDGDGAGVSIDTVGAGLGPRIGRRGRGRAVAEARAGAAGDAHRH
jgi:hypothetical protein